MRGRCLLSLLLALALTACNVNLGAPTATPVSTETAAPTPSATPTATATPTVTPTATPTVTPTPGPEARYERLVLVDQDTQTMRVYEKGVQIRMIPVSTGKPDQETTMTPAWEGEVGKYVGTFFAFGTYADHAWYLFDHDGGILIHSAPYLMEDDKKVYQQMDALGSRPVSHGCIRLPPPEAEWFTAWKPQGAHVIITPLTRSP